MHSGVVAFVGAGGSRPATTQSDTDCPQRQPSVHLVNGPLARVHGGRKTWDATGTG